MTIQDWGAVGEIIGAFGVIASLVYLAVQIRQNTQQISHSIEAARVASLERNIQSANRMRELLIVDRGLAELFIGGMRDFDALEGPDRLRFEFLLRNIFAEFQGAYIRHLSVGDDPDEFKGAGRMIETILENEGARHCLEQVETDWRPEFRAFVNGRIEAIDRRSRS
jgi:hypothetical protein